MKRCGIAIFTALISCATPGPREYHDGMPLRPPPAPAARPGVGAPVVGQPGIFDPREYPKSPYGRVLPEDENTRREPGIWAADDDGPIGDIDPEEVFIWPVPLPPNPAPHEIGYASICAVGAGRVLTLAAQQSPSEVKARMAKWGKPDADCVLARLFQACAILILNDNERANKNRAEDGRELLLSLKRIKERADQYLAERCTGRFLQGDAENLRSRATVLFGNWVRTYRKGVAK